MNTAQIIIFGGYSAAVYNKIKSVLQIENVEDVKELSEEERLADFKKEI